MNSNPSPPVDDVTQASQDLRFVRTVVSHKDRRSPTPRGILWVWALYVAIGYALLDINTSWGGWFLLVAGFAGGFLSSYLGYLQGKREGEIDRAEGTRHLLHWGSIILAVVGVIILGATHQIQGPVIGQIIAMMVGLVYFLGGVHFDRNFLWLGPILMAGSVAIGFLPSHGWTALGLLIGVGLVLPSYLGPRFVHE